MHYTKYLPAILMIILAFFGFSQKKRSADSYYQGENGETIYRLDNLSLRNVDLLSWHYVDSATRKPYNGILTRKFDRNSNPGDSLCIKNGISNGLQKHYWVLANNDSEKTIDIIEFYDPQRGYQLSLNRLDLNNNAKGSSYILYVTFEDIDSNAVNKTDVDAKTVLSFDINYESEIIYVKRTIRYVRSGKKEKQRLKFTSYEELQFYFKSQELIFYDKCKELGIFDEGIVIPVLKGNCN